MKGSLHLSLLFFVFPVSVVFTQHTIGDYYLPGKEFNPEILAPDEYFGFEIGDWHLNHLQLYNYARTLANASNRVHLEEYGESYEGRTLFTLVVSSPANLERLEEVREDRHRWRIDGKGTPGKIPLVLYQGYSIHGDEASGANASVLYAYYLAAGTDPWLEKVLEECVVLIDPTFNPDGLDRFASWVNSNKNLLSPSTDEIDRIHRMAWPGARTNHYWFDLNRDWLPARHPESVGRLSVFHKWKPNVLTDHHEMGADRTFFFQPGIPSRTNPLTPALNQDLTAKMAKYHADALDAIGSVYYTRESYDDFYYGKGSTYPDINGSVGILFEQAGVEGYKRETENGLLTFPFAIRNQLATSISTLKGAYELKTELINYQRDFTKSGWEQGKNEKAAGILIEDGGDPFRLDAFAELLNMHDLQFEKVGAGGARMGPHAAKYSLFLPYDQPGYPLIQALFQQETSFRDSLFYDVSAWTLPLAFNLPWAEVEEPPRPKPAQGQPMIAATDKEPVALAFEWRHYRAPALLYALQEAGINAKVAHAGFTATKPVEKDFDAGTVVIYLQGQAMEKMEVIASAREIAAREEVPLFFIESGLNPSGIDLGSPQMQPLEMPYVLMLAGEGVSAYDAGEVWYLMDRVMGIPVTRVAPGDLGRVELSAYNVLVVPEGNYGELGSGQVEKLHEWVKEGGTMILLESAINWGVAHKLSSMQNIGTSGGVDVDNDRPRAYDDYYRDRNSRRLGGAIFVAKADLTHPLLFGYRGSELPLFKNGTEAYALPSNPYAAPLVYSDDPLLAGYAAEESIEKIRGGTALSVDGQGSGRIVNFAFNPNFRGFWLGTHKLFFNAIFFARTVRSGTTGNP